MHLKRFTSLAAASALGLATAASAPAATLSLGLDQTFSGTSPASGTTPWVTAVFDDSFGGPNTVRLFMSGPNLTGGQNGENIAEFYFNFDPALDPTLLTFTAVNVSASDPENGNGDNGIFTAIDTFQADGDGKFDINYNFPPPPGNGSSRFTEGETVEYDLTYISAIDVNSFNFFSVMGGGQGSFIAAAHVQKINGGQSGWVGAVPEPATGLLMGMGLVGLGWHRRRR